MGLSIPRSGAFRLLHALKRRVMARAPDFVIGEPGSPYLERWYVIPRNPVFNVYLHRFRRSDDDRALHDHPWSNCSVILDGAYIEHTIADGGIHRRKLRIAGDVAFRGARAAHRVELTDAPHPVVTLFLTGPRVRAWGFHCPEAGWVHWEDFTAAGGRTVGRGCGEGGE